MREEIVDYAKTVTKNTLLTEIAKVVKTEEELEYIIKTVMERNE